MIEVKNLYHSYDEDEKYQVKDVTFTVEKGEIFGCLGPSGAGKSTIMNILTGLLKLQRGDVSIGEYEVAKIKDEMYNMMGVSFEQSNVYSKMTALENLEFYSKLFDVETRDPLELLEMVGLREKAGIRAGDFSKGMKHRLTFIRSMINNPEVWFLDEPTTGLDPAIASTIKDIIKSQKDAGVTTFLTTHNMFIADELCDRVAFIVDGEIRLIDSPKNLKLQYGEKFVDIEYLKDAEILRETLSIEMESEKQRIAHIISKHEIRTMHTKEATLEEIFIKVTGKELSSDETVTQL